MRSPRTKLGVVILPLLLAALLALGLGFAHTTDQAQAGEAANDTPLLQNTSAVRVATAPLLTSERATRLAPSSATSPALTDETDSLLVHFAPDASSAVRTEALRQAGLVEVETIAQLDVVVVKNADLSTDAARRTILENALATLKARADVIWAEPSHRLEQQTQPNDPVYPYQWGPAAVGLTQAWNVTTGSSAVTIAIIDTGLGYVSDFSGRVVSPYSVPHHTDAQWAWTDVYGHGTACAGIAAAMGNDGIGMAGAAWNVSLMPVHVSDSGAPTTSQVSEAFIYAADYGADIISVSLGSYQNSQTLASAVSYAVSHGVVIVAAAGNSGTGSGVQYPAAYPGVIAVGATNSNNSRASFSSTGNQLDLVAPGQSVASYAYAGNNQWTMAYWDGTSFSAPMVAGVAGLLLSHNPSLTAGQIASILAATADDLGSAGWESYYGDGLVDAQEAVTSAGDHSAPTVVYTQPANGDALRGQVEFRLSVADNVGVYKVEQYLDGAIQFTTMTRTPHYYDPSASGGLYTQDFAQPVVGLLDSTQFAEGSTHTVTAKAYDAAGNTRQASLTFTISNATATTSTTTAPTTTTTRPAPPSTTTTTAPSGTTTTVPRPQEAEFDDVAPAHPYSLQIADLASRGIVAGFDDGTFRPDAPVTRQQFAKMIVKALGLPVGEEDVCPFTDVLASPASADPLYPDNYVAVCAANGITVGRTPTSFAPYADITRAQLFTMVVRSLALPAPPAGYAPSFPAFDDTHYPNARSAAYTGLLDGLQGMGPGYPFFGAATRGEVCAVLYNLLQR